MAGAGCVTMVEAVAVMRQSRSVLPHSRMFPSSRTVASPKCSFRDPKSFLSMRGPTPRQAFRLVRRTPSPSLSPFAKPSPDAVPCAGARPGTLRDVPPEAAQTIGGSCTTARPRTKRAVGDLHQRIGPPPAALRLRHRYGRGPCLAFPPRDAQSGNHCSSGGTVGSDGAATGWSTMSTMLCCRTRICLGSSRADSRQPGHAPAAVFWDPRVAGRGRRMVTLADTGTIAPLRRA